MKKAAIGLFLCFVSLAFGQTLKLGVTANIHKSSIVNIHDYSKTPWGVGVGAFAEVSLVENDVFDSAWLYLSPQLEFSMQGENAAPKQGDQKFPMYYIGMPIYIKYFLHTGNYRKDLFFFGGPRLEFLVYNDRKGPEVYDMFVDQEKTVSEFGYGISVGAGFRISDNFEAFVRFDRGLSNIYPDYTHKSTTYNRMLGLGVNYYIKTE